MKHLALILSLLTVAGSAQAAGAIYRCGPDGRTYSQAPCADGQLVEAADPRTAAQRAEARRQQAAEREKGQAMERERLAAQKVTPAAVGSLGAAPAASAADRERGRAHTRKAKGKKKDDQDFVAVAPATKKASSGRR
jgi:hypothetical protein